MMDRRYKDICYVLVYMRLKPVLVLMMASVGLILSYVSYANESDFNVADQELFNKQEQSHKQKRNTDEVRVGAAECPPFVFYEEDGSVTGLTVYLWKQIAKNLNLKYTIERTSFPEHLEYAGEGRIDIGLSCTSISASRAQSVYFSYPFFETYVSIVTEKSDTWEQILALFKSNQFSSIVLLLFCLSIAVSIVFYFLEHNINDKIYAMDKLGWFKRIIEAFILGLLFITKGPFNYYEFKTLTGRVLAVLLGVFSTLFLASITALMASILITGIQSHRIRNVSELANFRIAVHAGTTNEAYAKSKGISYIPYESTLEQYHAVEVGVVDAIITDDAINRYLLPREQLSRKFENLEILPHQFLRQNIGIVISKFFKKRDELNVELLRIRETSEWEEQKRKYYGEAYLN